MNLPKILREIECKIRLIETFYHNRLICQEKNENRHKAKSSKVGQGVRHAARGGRGSGFGVESTEKKKVKKEREEEKAQANIITDLKTYRAHRLGIRPGVKKARVFA